jgi:hypothetical protein
MFVGVPVAIVLLAQSVNAAPPAASAPAARGAAAPGKASVASPREDCSPTSPAADQRSIVICAQRPNGYRLNPDVMEAKREKRKGGGGPPGRPSIAVQTPCSVGPMPCQSAGINVIGAAITAVTMVERAAKGENVGDMFVTDPHPSEYQLYQMAKKRREAHEAEIKAEAQAKARTAATVDPSEDSKSATPQPH